MAVAGAAIGPAAPPGLGFGGGAGDGGGGGGYSKALDVMEALEGVRRAFEEAEAFVEKVRGGGRGEGRGITWG